MVNAKFFISFDENDLRASVLSFAYAIICYIIASKHNNSPLIGLAIMLLYYPKFIMVL